MSRRNSNGDSSPPAGVSIATYSMQSEFITNASSTLNVPLNDLKLVYDTWPDNFACLFDMGLRAFEKLFSYRPSLKQNFDTTSEDAWKRDNRMKKIVLALEQTLAQAVATYADPQPDSSTTPGNFVETLQQIGGLHRAIASKISPDNFDMLFKLLPEVITDTISARRTSGPLTSDERRRFCNAWVEIAKLMSRHFILGWERRVIPKIPKFAQAYNRYQEESCRVVDTGAGPACGSTTPVATGSSPCQVGSPSIGHTAGATSGSATTGPQSTERRAATRRSDDDTARTIGRRFQHNPKRTKSASANETKPRGFFGSRAQRVASFAARATSESYQRNGSGPSDEISLISEDPLQYREVVTPTLPEDLPQARTPASDSASLHLDDLQFNIENPFAELTILEQNKWRYGFHHKK